MTPVRNQSNVSILQIEKYSLVGCFARVPRPKRIVVVVVLFSSFIYGTPSITCRLSAEKNSLYTERLEKVNFEIPTTLST